jgi:hypothetical protein
MAIDRKEYRAAKKAYKTNKKQGKAGKKDAAKADIQSKRNSRKTGEPRQYHGYVQIDLPKPKRSDYKKSETAVGDGPTPKVPSAKATGSSASMERMKKLITSLPVPVIKPITKMGKLPNKR